MTVFRVGPDDSKTGLFGHPRTTVELEDAINNSASGDTILIQAGYSTPQPRNTYVIEKDLTIAGDVDENDTNNFPIIYDGFKADKGASITVGNLIFNVQEEKRNALQAVNNSNLRVENITINNTVQQGEVYPVIFIQNDSTATFSKIFINSNDIKDGNVTADDRANIKISDSELNAEIDAYNSSVNLINSKINAPIRGSDSSEYQINNVTITYKDGNAINLHSNSSVIINNSRVDGGNNQNNYPCIYMSEANLDTKSTTVVQANYNGALFLRDQSTAKLDACYISSVDIVGSSEIALKNTCRISESIQLSGKSELEADRIVMDGKPNGRINLFASQGSNVRAEWIGFGLESNPVVKAEKTATINSKLYMFKYDKNQGEFLLDENNEYIITNKQVSVEYFETEKPKPAKATAKVQSTKPKSVEKPNSTVSASTELDQMIGLKKVKQQVKEFVAVSVMDKKRQEKGLPTSAQTLHSIFAGNPGTGKTTVARILGRLLYEKGVIKKNNLVETSRADLVASYIGQTAPKTRKVLESALGGILFIDEAYTLTPTSSNDFGGEAIDEILKFMEDHRSEIMIIFAGYSNEMEKFLQSNPGLKSRVPNTFEFEDYTTDEMIQIGLSSLKKQKYRVNEESYAELLKHNLSLSNDNSNGRWVRNFNESIVKKQALRLARRGDDVSDEELVTVTQEDLDAIKK